MNWEDQAGLQDNPVAPDSNVPRNLKFEFTGSGSEYFRIWIVNTLLTVVTLGIYSAWAKVRRLRYFYGSTQLAGSTFEYHGQGQRQQRAQRWRKRQHQLIHGKQAEDDATALEDCLVSAGAGENVSTS